MADRLLSVDSETKLPPQSVIDALAGEIGGGGSGPVDLGDDVEGVLPTTHGGTGLSTFTEFRFLTTAENGEIRAEKSRPVGAVVGTSDAQTLTNKTLGSPTITGNPTGLTKAHVGLGDVDNTADLAKPVSTATAAAIAANGPGVVAVLGPADPIPGGTPPGLIVRLAE